MFNLKKLLLFLFMAGCCGSLYAQSRVLKGKVTIAKDGSPLPGAAILIKGTTKGAAGGRGGLFTISIPAGPVTLEVKSIGYTTKDVAVDASQKEIEFALVEDTQQLGEVVVT